MSQQTESDAKRAMLKLVEESLPSGIPTRWQNVLFTPPLRTLWFAVNYVPVNNKVVSLGSNGENEVQGFVQVDVNVPMDSGEKESDDTLKTLEKRFVPGHSTVYDLTEAVVTACKRSPGRDVLGFWRVSLTVDFYSRIKRQTPTP